LTDPEAKPKLSLFIVFAAELHRQGNNVPYLILINLNISALPITEIGILFKFEEPDPD
jgi:hypothetical protein